MQGCAVESAFQSLDLATDEVEKVCYVAVAVPYFYASLHSRDPQSMEASHRGHVILYYCSTIIYQSYTSRLVYSTVNCTATVLY